MTTMRENVNKNKGGYDYQVLMKMKTPESIMILLNNNDEKFYLDTLKHESYITTQKI
jgi:hypothetical protein